MTLSQTRWGVEMQVFSSQRDEITACSLEQAVPTSGSAVGMSCQERGKAKESGCGTELLELKADGDIWPCLGASERGF